MARLFNIVLVISMNVSLMLPTIMILLDWIDYTTKDLLFAMSLLIMNLIFDVVILRIALKFREERERILNMWRE